MYKKFLLRALQEGVFRYLTSGNFTSYIYNMIKANLTVEFNLQNQQTDIELLDYIQTRAEMDDVSMRILKYEFRRKNDSSLSKVPKYAVITYKVSKIFLIYTIESTEGNINSLRYSLQLVTLKKNAQLLKEFLSECNDLENKSEQGSKYYNLCPTIDQDRHYSIKAISLTSILKKPLVYNDEVKQEIEVNLDKFLKSKDEYEKYGKIFKRTYLLVGPPGTGKTSMYNYIIKHYHEDYDFVIMEANNTDYMNVIGEGKSVDRVSHWYDDESHEAHYSKNLQILQFDDFDRMWNDKGEIIIKKSGGETVIKANSMLKFLDSVSENHIIIFTVNDISKIPKAVLRPGRIDKVLYLGNATKTMVETYLSNISGKDITLEKYEPKYTMSQIETITFEYRENIDTLIDIIENGKIASTKDLLNEIDANLERDNPDNV